MCLFNKDKTLHTAETPIVCYKVVFKTLCENEFASSIQGYIYELGKEHTLTEREYQSSSFNLGIGYKRCIGNFYAIYTGFHSFKRLCDAEREASYNPENYVILKCVIPVGARYWIGNEGKDYSPANAWHPGQYSEICSEKIEVTAWKKRGSNKWHYKKHK